MLAKPPRPPRPVRPRPLGAFVVDAALLAAGMGLFAAYPELRPVTAVVLVAMALISSVSLVRAVRTRHRP